MTIKDVRIRLNRAWEDVDQAAEAAKDSHSAVLALEDLYRNLPKEERKVADSVVIEWALSENEKKRFDALALIDKFKITSAVPVLRELEEHFSQSDLPSAPYSWAKVNRIIGRIVGDANKT